ncbi:DUF2062 domain-containing protein [Neptuniibacter sp.]|uniref:DUF2062 domain-containing protein n=1 Tax=Neptuniibacter sp. TaxID=1962643 RepID=UPI00261C0762|nr:DUF2062 domain-containing protein [Neptuniibacter sp.]MCP4596693.1 DUF2062 domain-containing protein [Neptuniibacter sp.]
MPRKLIKKYMPDEEKLKQHKHLSWLGSHIHEPNLWHLNRKSVSRAFLVGLFCAFLPIPFQMLVAAVLAIIIRSNLPISIGLVWITNPLTMPPIFYFSYLVGDFLIGDPNQSIQFEMTMEWLSGSLSLIWWPLLFGSVICGVVFGIAGYFSVQGFWAWHVGRSWKKRSDRGEFKQ